MQIFALFWLLHQGGAQQAPKDPPTEEEARRELNDLRVRQSVLEQRLTAAEAQLERSRQEPQPTLLLPPEGPHLRFGRASGFALGSASGDSEVRFRIVLHIDGREYLGDSPASADTFLLRRVRPFIEGTLWDFVDFRLMPDFPDGQPVVQDAYIDLHPWKWLHVRGGRFMVPIGLEWLQSDSTIVLVERSLATDLVPFRDLGVMVHGDVSDSTFSYQLAILNGSPDGGYGPDPDPQSDKDVVGRIFVRPLRPLHTDFTNLGLGMAGSYGSVVGTPTATGLPSYRSTGQLTIFSYLNDPMNPIGATTASGARWRMTPQMYWYVGPVGLLGEYVVSCQRVQRLAAVADLEHHAWNVSASIVLTLEHASYEGVVPSHPIDFRHKNFGAFELVGRYSELHLDSASFPTFASPMTSVEAARELAGGLNWYMTDFVRIMLSFEHTEFIGGAMNGNRLPENGLLGRLQVAL
jgi:phosphate-selective porin OprO and OprP